MKISIEHYNYLKAGIIAAKSAIPALKEEIANNPKVKNPELALRWGMVRKANLSNWLCDTLYSYLTDPQIDTALRHIMKEV